MYVCVEQPASWSHNAQGEGTLDAYGGKLGNS